MSWRHKQGRQWHYQLPGHDRFVCGSFFLTDHWETRDTIPPLGLAICRRCESLLAHAFTAALSYKGQSQRGLAVRRAG